MKKHTYDLERINKLLNDGFSEQDIKEIFRFNEEFEGLYTRLPMISNLREFFFEVVNLVQSQGLLEDFLLHAKERNPIKFELYEPYHKGVTYYQGIPKKHYLEGDEASTEIKELGKQGPDNMSFLQEYLDKIPRVEKFDYYHDESLDWRKDVPKLLGKIFAEDSWECKEYHDIPWRTNDRNDPQSIREQQELLSKSWKMAKSHLKSVIRLNG